MKLIVNLKLKPLESQRNALLATLKEANAACNWISEQAFENKIFKQFNLHKLVYHSAKNRFNLSAQMLVRAISKTADSYKIQTEKQTTFKPTGSIAYDDRIISFRKNDLVSIWTVEGRLNIPFTCGEYQRKLLPFRKGEIDLIYARGEFYLNAVCETEEPEKLGFSDILGIDFGIIQIATDSTGESFSGKEIERKRQIFACRRQRLQKKQTRSAKRKLRQLSGKQRRYQHNQNHIISKQIVQKAKALNSAIAIEDLKNIRKRTEKTVRKRQRAKLSNWAFGDLRGKLTYKCRKEGVQLFTVNPQNTSRTCSACGHCEKANRKSQSEFVCKVCSHSQNADHNAALNIRAKAAVNQPNGNACYQGINNFQLLGSSSVIPLRSG